MEGWVKDFDSWDICDQACTSLFDRTSSAYEKVHQWADQEKELVKRAAFSLLAGLAVHDKKANDQMFIDLLPLLITHAVDDRNYVKKAVNWALRSIGKRNLSLNKKALATAAEIQKLQARSARWIASDAIRELTSEKVQQKLERKTKEK